MPSPSPRRVAYRYAQEGPATATPPYLKRLLAYMEADNNNENSYWHGSWHEAIKDVQRLLRLGPEGIVTQYGALTVEDIFARFADRGTLDPKLITRALHDVPPPRPPRVKSPEEQQSRVDALVAALQAAMPSGTILYAHDIGPQHHDELKSWLNTFQTVKAKYPLPWKVMERVVKKVVVEGRPHGKEEAFWGLFLNINLKGLNKGLVGILIHELGHAFEDLQPDSFNIASWKHLYGLPPFSHTYMQERATEDFAECFRQFFQEPSTLRKQAPAKYLDMKERLAIT